VPYILLADRWFLAVLLLIAGLAKVRHAGPLAETVGRYGILPRRLVPLFAAVLPVTEVTLGVALAAGILPVLAGSLAAALFVGFTGALSWNLLRGRQFDCGCGLGREAVIGWNLAVRNVALTVLAAGVVAGPAVDLALWPGAAVPVHSPPAAALLPIPLIVIMASLLVRLAGQHWPGDWSRFSRPGRRESASGGAAAGH